VELETLDLHEMKHQDVENVVCTFLNWTEPPCRIITGNSKKMKDIAKEVIERYGFSCHNESTLNHGSLIITEKMMSAKK